MRDVIMDPRSINRWGDERRGWFPELPPGFDVAGTAADIDATLDAPM
ncbi:hypothetical protein [Candidatus Palauibacter sp.]